MQDVLDILTKRKAAPGLLYPHAKGGAIANAVGVYAPLEVDVARASSTFVISTTTDDRAADVVRQKGILLDNYKNNPIVLYGHGFSGMQFPIGRSTDDDGKLHVTRKENRTEATCFFAQSSWEAMQVFQLVEERILNCASIHIDPIKAFTRRGADGRVGLDIEESDLLEWSIVDIPCNPEAVRKVLDRGKLAGRKIAKGIEKTLKQYAAQPKGLVQGMSIEELTKAFPPKDDEDKKPKPEASDEGDTPPEASDEEAPDETGDAPAEGEGDVEGDQPPTNDQQQQNQQPQDFSQKPGAQLATGIHGAVSGFAQELSSQLARQENDAIQAMANDVVDLLNQIQLRCQDGYKQAYGQDIPAGGMGQQPQPQQVNPQDEQMLKRFVSALIKDAKTETPRKTEYSLRAIAKGLSDASMKQRLTPEEMHRLGHWAKRLMEVVDEGKALAAKEMIEQSGDQEQDAFYRAAAELLKEQKSVSEKLQSLRVAAIA